MCIRDSESKEYPETNESIQILSRISGDNKLQAPIPKGQNLYSMYENRAYKATVTGLGNAMIQPTQYFQLDNVPMFNGAYLILGVEHTMTANKMTTSFAGTKILEFPIPRVLNPAALFGFNDGASDYTNIADRSVAGLITGSLATFMSQARLDDLDSVYGVDISHWNIDNHTIDYDEANANNGPDNPEIKFSMMKLSQNEWNDKQAARNANDASTAGIKLSYYHFGEPYQGNDPVGDATGQANFFVDSIANLKLPEPDFPLILDFENITKEVDRKVVTVKAWSTSKTRNTQWINTFIDVVQSRSGTGKWSNGYEIMLYGGKSMFEGYTENNFGRVPLWHPAYPSDPEMSSPKIASGWNDWSIWQFSPAGRPDGFSKAVDVNAMRRSFFEKYT